MASRQDELRRAVDLALAKDWEAAHAIAQHHEGDAAADWLHAVLHKIEGDTGNAATGIGAAVTRSKSSPTPRPSLPPFAVWLLIKR